jgi:hypothetical protein
VVDPAVFRQVSVKWADASSPLPAASADEVSKYIGVGVLRPRSKVTWNRAGFSDQMQQELAAEEAAEPTVEEPVVDPKPIPVTP